MLTRIVALPLLLAALVVVLAACSGDADEANGDPPSAPTFDLNDNGDGGDSLRQDVHWHADFRVVINGELFDFSQPQYVTEEGEETAEARYLHIHPPRFTVAHIHREQSTWREFFGTFDWTLADTYLEFEDGERLENDDESTWKFFVNGVQVDSIMLLDISDLQRVLMVYGPKSPEEALELYWPEVTDQACAVSGSCADRIDPNEPPEPCSGRGSCT